MGIVKQTCCLLSLLTQINNGGSLKRSRNKKRPIQRGIFTTTKPRLLKPYKRKIHETTIIDDRRTYHPESSRPVLTANGKRAGLRLAQKTKKGYNYRRINNRLAFTDPFKTTICKRRRKRRQVLFATGRAGKGKRGPKKRTYTAFSDVRC